MHNRSYILIQYTHKANTSSDLAIVQHMQVFCYIITSLNTEHANIEKCDITIPRMLHVQVYTCIRYLTITLFSKIFKGFDIQNVKTCNYYKIVNWNRSTQNTHFPSQTSVEVSNCQIFRPSYLPDSCPCLSKHAEVHYHLGFNRPPDIS